MKIPLPFHPNESPAEGLQDPAQVLPDGRICITLGASQIDNYLMCPAYWSLSAYQRLRRQPLTVLTEDNNMDHGTYGHSLIETYYTEIAHGSSIDVASSAVYDSLHELREASGFLLGTCEKMENAFNDYIIKTKLEKFDFTPIAPNAVETGFSKVIYEDTKCIFIIQGRIDLLAWWPERGSLAIVDHKFQFSVNDLYGYNPQFRTYAMVVGAKYLIANYIRVYAKSTTFDRKISNFTRTQHEQWKQYIVDRVFWPIFLQYGIHDDLRSIEEDMNLHACKGEYGPCPYTHICNNEGIVRAYNKKTLYYIEKGHVPW